MFFPEGQIRVHLYGQPVDMRKSFDGLYALTRQGLGLDPLSGRLFVLAMSPVNSGLYCFHRNQ
jgi:transposase